MNKFLLAASIILFIFFLPHKTCGQANQTVTNGGNTTAVNLGGTGCTYNWVNSNPAIGLPASGTGNIPAFTVANNGTTSITASITATPVNSGFAYIISTLGFISAISTATNTVVNTSSIPGQPYGVAASPDGRFLYVTDKAGGYFSKIDASTLAAISYGGTGPNSVPEGIAVSPDGNTIYVTDGFLNPFTGTGGLSVFDAATLTLITTIPLDIYPADVIVSPDGSKVFVTNEASNTISVISSATNTVLATVPAGRNPDGMVITHNGSKLYVTNYSGVSVINTASNSLIAIIPVANYGVGLDGSGIAVSPNDKYVYVVNESVPTVSVIDTQTETVVATIDLPGGQNPFSISLSPDGSEAYVVNQSGLISVINTATNSVTTSISTMIGAFSYGSNFTSSGVGCNNTPVNFTITVNPSAVQPTITVGAVTGNISALAGSPSVSPQVQQFTVSGNNLTTDIIATAPLGFEVSLAPGTGYGSTVTLTQTGGTVNSTIIYVRSAAADPAGNITGNVGLTSNGVASQNVAVAGTINPLPTVNGVANQTVTNGGNTIAVNFAGAGCIYNWVNNTPGIGLPTNGMGNIPSFTAVNNGNTTIVATFTATPAQFAYIANLVSGNVSVINLTNNLVAATIPVGASPIGVSVTPDGTSVYVTNQGSNNVSVINTASNSVIATIPIGPGTEPTGVVVAPNGGKVYTANYGYSTISVINAATHTVINTIAVGANPYGIAISPDGKWVYTANVGDNTVSVVSTATNAMVSTINAGAGPNDVCVSPDGSTVYVTNYFSNTVSVISTATNSVIKTIPVGSGAEDIALSPDGSTLYVTNINDNTVSVINTLIANVINTINVGVQPAGLSVTADGSMVYVTNANSNSVSIINTLTNLVTGTIPVGPSPLSLGNFISGGTGCAPITFTITVYPSVIQPIIAAGAVTGNISGCSGSPSASPLVQQFTVSGSALTADIIATAPPGFELSLTAGAGYSNNVTLTQTGGTVNSTTLYVRSAAGSPPGNITGTVVLTSNGTASQSVAVSGTVNALPTVNPITNQTVASGAATATINFTGTGNIFSWTNNTPGIGLAAIGTGDIPAFTAINTTNTPITANITVTSINKQAGYEYMTNAITSQVSVISNVTNNIVATIDVGNGPYGMALSPDGSLAYVSNYNGNSVSVINTSANNVVATIPVGFNPIGIATSPDGSKIYVCCSSSVFVIDGLTNQVITAITLPNYIQSGVVVSPDGKWLYVPDPNNGALIILNTSTYQQTNVNILTNILDPAVNAVVSPDGSLIYVTGGNTNNIYVISAVSQTIVKTINIGASAIGIAISPDGSRIYVTNEFSNMISVVDVASNTLITTIPVGNSPEGISVSPDGSTVYVANVGSNNMSIINTSNNQVTATIPAGATPHSLGNFVKSSISCSGPPITFSIIVNAATANITATGPLSALTTIYGTPSASIKFTISGTNMTAGILVTPPAGFEVSTDNITFSSTVTVGLPGAIAPTAVYIRLTSATPAGNNYSGNIVLSSTGAPNVTMAMPASTVNPALLTITTNNQTKTYGTPNPALTVSYSGFVNGETQTVLQTPANISTIATAVSPVGSYPITVNGATAANYIMSFIPGGALTITPASLIITANNVNKAYGATLTGGPTSTAFTTVGLQNSETVGSVTIAYGQGSSTADPTGTYTGTVIASSAIGGTFAAGNYTIIYTAGDIIVGAAGNPVLTASGTLLPLNTTYGSPSSSESFSVSGTNLVAAISITPPIGFEVSTDNITFSGVVTLGLAGNVAPTKVYIRLTSKTPVGGYSGNIVLKSGVTGFNMAIPNSLVNPATLTITADNKTKLYGAVNPTLTVTYTGFVNNEGPAQLTAKPQLTTTATITSTAGSYPIIVGGAVAANYDINYVPGILTIIPADAFTTIPNCFTPNGDSINDNWDIAGLINYPHCVVSVFTRYGTLIYQSRGYPKPWDGTYNGSRLPSGVYYYLIDLRNNTAPLSGSLTILR